MFNLFNADERRAPHGGKAPLLISTTVHLVVVVFLIIAPLVYVSTELPPVPDMLAFVVSAAPAPPPPPPPPAAPAAKSGRADVVKSQPPTRVRAAPVEAPTVIEKDVTVEIGADDGVPGGVEGGVVGGVVGGIVGGLVTIGVPPPPPPPLPPAPLVERAPVRIGGELTAPALLERVEPTYPPLALRARMTGMVILEAVVDRDGRVEEVRVLRSMPFLDAAAVEAVRQWRYSPLLLNGQPERFVLTVTLNFSLPT